MNSFNLFESFSPEHKGLGRLFIAVLIAAIVFMGVYWVLGLSPTITWESAMISELKPVTISEIISYPFTIDLNIDTVMFNEFFSGSPINISAIYALVFLGFWWLALIVFLSISTYLSRIWYFVASSLFIAIVMFLKPDLAFMLFEGNWMAAIMMITFLGLSYYFQSFNKEVTLPVRLLSFTILSILLALALSIFSLVESPFLYLAAYGYPVPFVVTIIAIFMVGHDIIAGLLNIVSSGIKSNKDNWKHFYFISFIYLINVALMYMNEIHMIDWKLLEVSPILFFLIAYIVGIKGFKDRENQYSYLFSYSPLGALFYMAMGITAFVTIGFLLANGNDPALEVIEDFILYSQLGYGLMFLIYVTSNFLHPMTNGVPVYKILYKADAMPYFTYRLAGLITFAALMFVVNWKLPLHQSISGYYNSLGDAHYLNDERVAAIGYYTKGGQYGYYNHRSNYALANMAMEDEKFDDALDYYTKAVAIRPSEFAYANLSNLYLNQKQYFDALFTLQDGLKKFPESGALMNNLGMLYGRGETYDSAIHYLKLSMMDENSQEVAYNNIFNILSKSDLDLTIDSLQFENENDWVNKVNRLAYLNLNRSEEKTGFTEPDSSLTVLTDAYLYNYMINTLWQKDTTHHQKIGKIASGYTFSERKTKLVKGLFDYYQGEIYKGLQQIDDASFGEASWAGQVYDILGRLYLQLGDEQNATDYFERALKNYHNASALPYAIALTKNMKGGQAAQVWDSLAVSNNPALQSLAMNVQKVLSVSSMEAALELSDQEKYQFLLFSNFRFEEDLISTFEDKNIQAQALLNKAYQLYDLEKFNEVKEVIEKIKTIEISESAVQNQLLVLEMRIEALSNNVSFIEQHFNSANLSNSLENYFKAKISVSKNDSASAEAVFNEWALKNPYNEDLNIMAYKYFEQKGNIMEAYNIIQRAASMNKYSVRLLKEYVRYCGRSGNINFGIQALQEAEILLSESDYDELYDEFYQGIEQWKRFSVE